MGLTHPDIERAEREGAPSCPGGSWLSEEQAPEPEREQCDLCLAYSEIVQELKICGVCIDRAEKYDSVLLDRSCLLAAMRDVLKIDKTNPNKDFVLGFVRERLNAALKYIGEKE